MHTSSMTNQVNRQQGILCLVLLLLALVFSSISSLNMTLMTMSKAMITHDMSASEMFEMDQESEHSSHCQMSDMSHCDTNLSSTDHTTCSEAHCSTMPVLATQFEAPRFHHSPVHNDFELNMVLSSFTSSPYIPPITA